MIFEKVKAILVKELSLSEEEVTMTSSFEELGIDSLDLVELVMQIEEEFDITMEESESLKTVKDVVDHIESKVNS
ncbi:acyl carrier protein [Proteiniclasticum sp.]|uniref:acyl carrier protein n=1 Tax=Proteiniclasticum sp. TaxID=2053595 RepID=UPI00289D2842|nr:acyl carrier protein [Proteiniclasticum sp.]